MGDVRGLKIGNLLGSNGTKAVALALLGADVTVVDIAPENARYAHALADHAGVSIRYIVSDVLALPQQELTGDYDVIMMEFGILHYFIDLSPLMENVYHLLKPGGRLVLQDFHPISTKLISSRGRTAKIRKHKVDGDYFDSSIKETEVAYAKFLPEEEKQDMQKVQIRQWTLGEIVTAIAQSHLMVKELVEAPNRSSEVFDKGIPKSFTIVAEKQGHM
nr:class I SAM-dependent methyltransferase [Caldalkalibacillus salinus]